MGCGEIIGIMFYHADAVHYLLDEKRHMHGPGQLLRAQIRKARSEKYGEYCVVIGSIKVVYFLQIHTLSSERRGR
jgi:hypothetical protein